MDRWNKIENIVGAVLFGSLGIGALVAAVFYGATHQYVVAAIGAVMTAALVAEIVIEERKAKRKNQATA